MTAPQPSLALASAPRTPDRFELRGTFVSPNPDRLSGPDDAGVAHLQTSPRRAYKTLPPPPTLVIEWNSGVLGLLDQQQAVSVLVARDETHHYHPAICIGKINKGGVLTWGTPCLTLPHARKRVMAWLQDAIPLGVSLFPREPGTLSSAPTTPL